MRISRGYVGGLAIAVITVGLWFGCSGLECGDGTVESDGQCIAELQPCPEDAVYENGQCVLEEPVECGEGTERDPTDNRCYSTDEVCDDSTAFSSELSRCVPTDEVCDEGTVFDAERGLCTVEGDCGSGEVWDDGECTADPEALANHADVVAQGNTDPEFGGEPVDIDFGDPGESTIFAGVIGTPQDLNGDGQLDQSRDHFRFEAAAGDWIEVELFSLGLPSPEFSVMRQSEDGVEYQRRSPMGSGDHATRQFVIPKDGHYLLAVEPGDGAGEQPVGDDDWDYVGTVQSMQQPEPTDFAFDQQDLEHQIGELDDNYFYSQDYDAGETLELTWKEPPEDTEYVIQAWASASDYIGEFDGSSAEIEIPNSGELRLVVDWSAMSPGGDGDYRISGQYSGNLTPGEQRHIDAQLDERDGLEVGWTSSQTTVNKVEVAVEDEQGQRIYQGEITEPQPAELPNLEAGAYDITFLNATNTTLDNFEPEVTVVEPTEMATFDASVDDVVHIEQDNNDFLVVDIIAVHDNSQEVVASKYRMDRSTGLIADFLALRAAESGQHTVYIYEYQSLDNSNISVDAQTVDTVEIGSFNVSGADAHSVVEVGHDYDELLKVLVEHDNNSTERVFGTVADDEHLSVVGVETGPYSVHVVGDDGPDGDDVQIDTEFVDPLDISDFSQTFSGSANDDYVGSHDFYHLELDDTTHYDIELEQTGGGTGLARVFVYEMAHQLVRRSPQSTTIGNPSSTTNMIFEADTPYIIRVGNDRIGAGHFFDYELSFDEVN